MTTRQKASRFSAEMLDGPPPADVGAEKQYIGAVLLSREVLEQHPVDPSDFHTDGLGRLCETLQNYPLDGPVTLPALLAWIPREILQAIGGKPTLAECVDATGHVGHAGLFAQRIKTAAAKRRIIARLLDGVRHAYNGHDDPGALIAEITSGLESIGNGQTEERFNLLSMADLDSTDFSTDYVVEGVLAVGEPCIIGGMFKVCKTTIALDLLLSIGTGVPFLGHFPVLRTARAVYFLGEGRGRFAQDVCRRVAAQKGITLSDVQGIHLCMDLPNLDDGGDLHQIERRLRQKGAEFAFFDPLYLGLGQSGEHASNLFVIGQRLAAVQRACQAAGATASIVHHLRKGRIETEPATLADLAQAGAAEFAGQWLLVNRTRPYDEANPGSHDLRLCVGSRLTDSCAWGVHIEEGTARSLCGRFWRPELTPWVDAVKADRDARQDQKTAEEAERVEARKTRIIQAMAKFPDGTSKTRIRDGAGLHDRAFGEPFAQLIDEGAIVACEIRVGNQKSAREGYRLAE